jgi:hypothetical protein
VRALPAALAAAVAAGAILPGRPLGVAVPLVAALVAVAITLGCPLSKPAHAAVFGALALALAAMPAVRDATWVVTIDLVAAFVLASVAVTGGGDAGELAVGATAALCRLVDVPSAVASAELDPSRARSLASIGRSLLFGGLVTLPFGALFWSADRAFAELGSSLPLPDLSALPARLAVFALVLTGATGLLLAARRPAATRSHPSNRRIATLEWAIPLALLDLLFLAFVLVQVTVLFAGNEHVLTTTGLTYAEYAREGFAQLLVAAALTLAVVAGAARLAHGGSRLLLRVLLGALCLLTLVIVASALRRLDLYEEAYGFSRLRVSAHAIGLWLAGLFGLVLAGGLTRHARWLPRAIVGATGTGLLAFSLVNPDGLVARHNVERWRETGKLDLAYVGSLSADAVPALAELPPALRERALRSQWRRLLRHEPWSSANLARARARGALARGTPFGGNLSAVSIRRSIEREP